MQCHWCHNVSTGMRLSEVAKRRKMFDWRRVECKEFQECEEFEKCGQSDRV